MTKLRDFIAIISKLSVCNSTVLEGEEPINDKVVPRFHIRIFEMPKANLFILSF